MSGGCSGIAFLYVFGRLESSMDDGCCGVYQLEGSEQQLPLVRWGPRYGDEHRFLVQDRSRELSTRFVSLGHSCTLDAGGLPFTLLTDVNADDSVTWLSSLVTADDKRHSDQALAAIAMHQTQKATAALEGFASLGESTVAAREGGILAGRGSRTRGVCWR